MSDPTFSRIGTKPRGNGYTMVPHWLWTAPLKPQARLLLGWLHSHADAFLAKITMNHCRQRFGSDIGKHFDALEAAGLLAVERGPNGKAARITLLDDAWQSAEEPRWTQRGDRAELSAPTALDSARIEEQGEDQGEQSSLRSDEDQTQVATRTYATPTVWQDVAKTYWDWHVEARGRIPAVKFPAIMAVAKKLLGTGYTPDEIVDAMQTATAMNQKAVQDEIHRLRRVADEQAGPPIPAAVVKAFAAADHWFADRAPSMPRHNAMQVVAWFVTSQQWGVGETMLRLAVSLRANPVSDVDLRAQMWRAKVDRFPGDLADYPDAMERAYRNQWWRAQ